MWILPLLGYVGMVLGFCFLTLAIGEYAADPRTGGEKRTEQEKAAAAAAKHGGLTVMCVYIASGLYYLSELVEEHTVAAKKLLTRLIYGVVAVYVLLVVVDGFPFWLSLLAVVSHGVYAGNLRRFPTVKLSDPVFIVSCGLHPPNRSQPLPSRAVCS